MDIDQASALKIFRDIDRQLAGFIREKGGSEVSALTALVLSRELGDNHVCLELREENPRLSAYTSEGVPLFPVQDWKAQLAADRHTVGRPGEYKPLICDGDRVYLQRYWAYEQLLGCRLAQRANVKTAVDIESYRSLFKACRLGSGTGDLSGLLPEERQDLQTAAVLMALQSGFSVISGGPGTGKTTVLARILAVMIGRTPRLNVALAAPTGKAAMRMNESLLNTVGRFDIPGDLKDLIVRNKAVTLHRLLGRTSRTGAGRFGSDAERKLDLDILVVDEVSMIDLALMTKLVSVLNDDATLILLGDKNQLSSVEAGSVLADICEAFGSNNLSEQFVARANRLIPDRREHLLSGQRSPEKTLSTDIVIHLQRNYRFGSGTGIGRISRKMVQEEAGAESVVADMTSGGTDDSFKLEIVDPGRGRPVLDRKSVVKKFAAYLGASDPEGALAALADFKILTPLNTGPFGVHEINARVERILADAGMITPDREFYTKRPVLVLENDYSLGLFNGDEGVVMADQNGSPRVFFTAPDGVKAFIPTLLPRHQTAFCLTVHKSQGSEFKNVLFLMPDREVPVATMELVYTGITRARARVDLTGTKPAIAAALKKKTIRSSGLIGVIHHYLKST